MAPGKGATTKAGQRTIAGVVGAIVLVVAVLILARPYLPISCTVGAAGTALNVTAGGWGAGKACETMMNTASTNVNGFTPYSTNPFGQVVCVVPLGSVTYTVRDTGLLDIFGNAVCQYLQQQTPAAKAAASASADASVAAASASASAAVQQQLADERTAIDKAASAVTSDLRAITDAEAHVTAALNAVPADLKTEQKDLDKTHADEQATLALSRDPQNVSDGSCGASAGGVGADAGGVGADQGAIGADQGGLNAEEAGLDQAVSSLQADVQQLTTAEAALPSYTPSAPSDAQISKAISDAHALEAQANQTMKGYLAQAQSMANTADGYASTASASCGS
jgi:hypothetical protein